MPIAGFGLTRIPQMPLAEHFATIMFGKLALQLQDRFSWEILEELSSHYKVDEVTHHQLIAAYLVFFLTSPDFQ